MSSSFVQGHHGLVRRKQPRCEGQQQHKHANSTSSSAPPPVSRSMNVMTELEDANQPIMDAMLIKCMAEEIESLTMSSQETDE